MYYKFVAFDIYTTLIATGDDITFQTGSSIVAGDATFSIDGANFANLGTLPFLTPTGTNSRQVKISVAAGENTGTYGQIILRDLAGDQWNPVAFAWKNDEKLLDSGTAQTGTSTTITLRSNASSVDDLYNGGVIEIIGGTGVGQSRQIADYVGSTKSAVVSTWATNPNNTSIYLIHPAALVITFAQLASEIDTVQLDLTGMATGTAAAVWNYSTRTLTDFGSLTTGTAAAVWAYPNRSLTVPVASGVPVSASNPITVYQASTWSISLTGLGNISIYDTIYMTVKYKYLDPDSKAVLQVRNGANGLRVFNQADPVSTGNGTLVIDNAVTGAITITIQEEETIHAPIWDALLCDLKGIDTGGQTNPITFFGLNVEGIATKAIV